MPRRGYRFIGPVAAIEEDGATAGRHLTGSGADRAWCPRGSTHREPAPIGHPEAERRRITALSCELIRAAAGGMDLEDWREAVGGLSALDLREGRPPQRTRIRASRE